MRSTKAKKAKFDFWGKLHCPNCGRYMNEIQIRFKLSNPRYVCGSCFEQVRKEDTIKYGDW